MIFIIMLMTNRNGIILLVRLQKWDCLDQIIIKIGIHKDITKLSLYIINI